MRGRKMSGCDLPALSCSLLLAVLAVCASPPERCDCHSPRSPPSPSPPPDPGHPLFLTPFIEAGNVAEAQQAAAVEPLGGTVTSYAGFLTVNKELGSHMFLWYFPAEQDPHSAPVVLWLQGGPGSSSLIGLFEENGPYIVEQSTLRLRGHLSWSRYYNMLYIDNPVGTGYSFTGSDQGYARNQTTVGEDLYQAVVQFFQLFPDLQGRDFYITGESYAGKYIPALGYAIHRANPEAAFKINLQGLAIGNGYCDPEHMMAYGDYLFQLGLLDSNGRDLFHEYEARIVKYIREERWMEAFQEQDVLVGGDFVHDTLFYNLTGFDYTLNFLYTEDPSVSEGTRYVQLPYVRRALHVGAAAWSSGERVLELLREDEMRSVAPWIEALLDAGVRVLVYSGQLDIIIPYALSDGFVRKLSWSGAGEFAAAQRRIWRVAGPAGGGLAGYATAGGGLTQVLVRAAGHMVPLDQPEWTLDMLDRFINNKPF